MLKIANASSQYVTVNKSTLEQYLNQTDNWTITLKWLHTDMEQRGVWLGQYTNAPLYGFAVEYVEGGYIYVVYYANSAGVTDHSKLYVFDASALRANDIYQITISHDFTNQTGGRPTVRCWVNTRELSYVTIVHDGTIDQNADVFATLPANLEIGHQYVDIGTTHHYNDFAISDMVIFKSVVDPKYISSFINNEVPKDLQADVVAHYPFNQIEGNTVYDVVHLYNYAKVSPLTPVHGALVNYSALQYGGTNQLAQTAWHNLYTKGKKGQHHLSGNGVDTYAACDTYTPDTYTNWTIKIQFTFQAAFNKPVWTNQTATTSDWIGIRCMSAFGSEPGYNIWIFGTGLPGHQYGVNRMGRAPVDGEQVEIVLSVTGTGTTLYNVVIKLEGGFSFTEFTTTSNINWTWNKLQFLKDNLDGIQATTVRLGHFILIEDYLNDSQIALLFNAERDKAYRSLGNIVTDIDFGDIFLSGSDYLARDNSGNGNHAKLYNFTVASDLPLYLEKDTKLPARKKALRLIQSSNHYLSIASFNPTKEKGYTYIIGIKTLTNGVTNFFLFSNLKGDTSYGIQVGLLNDGGVSYKEWQSGAPNIININTVYPVHAHDGITYYAFTSQDLPGGGSKSENILNGSSVQTVTDVDSINDHSLNTEDMKIGKDVVGGATGYLLHASIYKGILTLQEIRNIISDTLYGNALPSLMVDCQLYLNFEEILVNGSTYTIRDWSPLKRTVLLNNYTANEVNPAHADYKLYDANTLR